MRGVCVSLGQRGYAIAANYRAPRTNADETVRAVRAAGGRVEAFPGDAADPDQAVSLVAEVVAKFERVDVLVAGAGPMIVKDAFNMTIAEYRSMIEGNLGSVVYCVKAVLPRMR